MPLLVGLGEDGKLAIRFYSCHVSPSGKQTITVVSCHFGDPFWISHMCRQLDRFSDERLEQIVLVDQSRNSREALVCLPRVSQVLSFPVDQEEMALVGHDHPASVNRALRSIDFTTSHVLVLDSDCFPIAPDWLDHLHDVSLASDPRHGDLSHPCFMLFPAGIASQLDFAEDMRSNHTDTGRHVGAQIARLGLEVRFNRPQVAFSGYRGHFMLNRRIYHHGSASFASSPDSRLNGQIDRTNEARLRELAESGNFELTRKDLMEFELQGARRRLTSMTGSR